MNIQFLGGILDGHEETMPDDQGWHLVQKIGITDRTHTRVTDPYRYVERRLTADGITVKFVHDPELVLEPGEQARFVRLPASFWS